jgi:hypothetical protein
MAERECPGGICDLLEDTGRRLLDPVVRRV